MSSISLEFTCPKCRKHDIEEVMVDVVVASDIHLCEDEDGSNAGFDYGQQTNDDGNVDRYQCKNCGWTILDDKGLYDRHTQDGLGGDALISRIRELNTPVKGDLVSHDELVTRISDQYSTLTGEELAEEWNRLFPEQVIYEGDSMYWVQECPSKNGSNRAEN